jgi:hypothetical protein
MLRAGLLALGVIAMPAAAQVTSPAPQTDQSTVQRFIERFNAANTTHDGRLTLAQAQAGGMPIVVQHFDEIDAQHRGYVTLQDIGAWRQQSR